MKKGVSPKKSVLPRTRRYFLFSTHMVGDERGYTPGRKSAEEVGVYTQAQKRRTQPQN